MSGWMYVGVDVSKRKCWAAVVDGDGVLVDEFSFSNDFEGIKRFVSRLSGGDCVVMESTGNLWVNLFEAVEASGVRAVLANPLKMRAIASAKIKNDRVDAKVLASLLRGGLVAECYVPPKEVRALRALVRHRVQLVKSASMVKNRVHSLLERYGFRREFSDLFGKAGLEWLRRLELKPLDKLLLDNFIEQIECLEKLIENVDAEIGRRASIDEDVRLLLSLTGVNVYSALLIKSEIGDVKRFPNYKKLVSWAGLAPSLYQSGSIERHGHITKQGSAVLRWVMVECARVAVRYDVRLGEFYERVRRRRGEQKALVAVAAKMLKIVWFMLTRREPYQSRNARLYGDKLNRLSGY
ncbi:MAG: IS110 family transposase [Candidatus Bathyarchaeota archaeon]|nr:IS110 family transposase [Candidatus Bathyarchaeota archaeon]